MDHLTILCNFLDWQPYLIRFIAIQHWYFRSTCANIKLLAFLMCISTLTNKSSQPNELTEVTRTVRHLWNQTTSLRFWLFRVEKRISNPGPGQESVGIKQSCCGLVIQCTNHQHHIQDPTNPLWSTGCSALVPSQERYLEHGTATGAARPFANLSLSTRERWGTQGSRNSLLMEQMN